MIFSARELADCADREVKQRRKVYPRRVAEGGMSQEFADRQVAMMEQIASLLATKADLEETQERLL